MLSFCLFLYPMYISAHRRISYSANHSKNCIFIAQKKLRRVSTPSFYFYFIFTLYNSPLNNFILLIIRNKRDYESAVILHEAKLSLSKAKVCKLFLNSILYNMYFESMSKIVIVINQSNKTKLFYHRCLFG